MIPRKPLVLLGVAACCSSAVPAHAQEVCDQIDAFVKAQIADPDKPHWIEMHWGYDPDPQSLWSKACRSSDDDPSRQFCGWIFEHASAEFRSNLPIEILKCYGYRFPRHAANEWTVFDGEFQPEHSEAVWLKMEMATKGLRERESALRLSVVDIDPDSSFDGDELPTIRPYPVGTSE